MLLKGFKRDLLTIEYDQYTPAVVLGYKYAHIVISQWGIELYEVEGGQINDQPLLVDPTAEDLQNKLKELKNGR